MMLDLQSVRLFVLVADLGNFSRAASAAGTVQPVVSQRIRALEESLGRTLFERTPRYVRLTTDGAQFLERARALLAAHDTATRFDDEPPIRFALGVSDQAVGVGLHDVVKAVRAALPATAVIELRLGMSSEMRALYDAGAVDAAILRREAGSGDGEVIGRDPLGWRGLPGQSFDHHDALPLALLAEPCGVRTIALRALERARRPWREAFVAGGYGALITAVQAGLGIAPMGAAASGQLSDVGDRYGLPPLPVSEVVLVGRTHNAAMATAIDSVIRTVRTILRA